MGSVFEEYELQDKVKNMYPIKLINNLDHPIKSRANEIKSMKNSYLMRHKTVDK